LWKTLAEQAFQRIKKKILAIKNFCPLSLRQFFFISTYQERLREMAQ